MFEHDYDEFEALLDAAISLNPNWKPLNATGLALFFKAMEPYSLDLFSAALTAHIRDPKHGMFQPSPAHLIGKIEALSGGDGRPSDGEAWAIALTSRDEADTVVWTSETAEAFAICQPVLSMGDEVGARMAFKDAYTRLVGQARAAGKTARWQVSIGWDGGKREAAIKKAVVAGFLPAATARALLPNHSDAVPMGNCPEGLKRVKEELAKLQAGWSAAAKRRAQEAEAEREAERQRKVEIDLQVQKYMENGPDHDSQR